MKLHPAERLGANGDFQSLRNHPFFDGIEFIDDEWLLKHGPSEIPRELAGGEGGKKREREGDKEERDRQREDDDREYEVWWRRNVTWPLPPPPSLAYLCVDTLGEELCRHSELVALVHQQEEEEEEEGAEELIDLWMYGDLTKLKGKNRLQLLDWLRRRKVLSHPAIFSLLFKSPLQVGLTLYLLALCPFALSQVISSLPRKHVIS